MPKKGQESSVNGHNHELFLPNFQKLGHLECYNTPKRHVVLKVCTENKLFYFSKRALRPGTARNKFLKEALTDILEFLKQLLFD